SRTLCAMAASLGDDFTYDKYSDGPSLDKKLKLKASFCQTYPFLAPEQKTHFSQQHPRADTYAFGILLYYLLIGEFPEGYFDLPSKRLGELKWNWDLLICKCLQTDPFKRPDQLSHKLDELLACASKTARHQLHKIKETAQEKANIKEPVAFKPVLRPQEI